MVIWIMTQIIIILSTLIVFAILGFMMNRSIKKFEERSKVSKKKGKGKYMPEVKKFGK